MDVNNTNRKKMLTKKKSMRKELDKSVEKSFNSCFEENMTYCYSNIIDELIGNKNESVKNAKVVTVISNDVPQRVKSINALKVKEKEKVEQQCIHNKKRSVSSGTQSVEIIGQYYHTDDGILVVLNEDDKLYFYGIMTITVLHGEIEILGARITKNQPDIKLYSLRSASLLYLKNVTKTNLPIIDYLVNLPIPRKKLTENCAVILCKKLNDPCISFIEKHTSQQILPRIDEIHQPRVTFHPRGNWNLIKSSNEWDHMINTISISTKMLICGGKGVGKSTFIKYVINKLLMKFSEIQIIDLDPGQPEFTIPGCISILKVNKPLFGANFTHFRKPEISILSNINITHEPENFIESVKLLLQHCSDNIPTLVNFMGFTHGIGINILSAAIVQMEPTDVVQIESEYKKKNYKEQLTKEIVAINAKLFIRFISARLTYKLWTLRSMSDQNDGWIAEPRQLREMSILGYVNQMTRSDSIFNINTPMYKISLKQISIADLSGKTIHPAAVNANLVALCSLLQGVGNIFQCRGWGIVRGIDWNSDEMVLIMLEENLDVEDVTHVVLNSAPLPPSIFMTPDEVVGQMPYVMEGSLMSFGQIPKRSRLSVKSLE